MPQQLTSVRAIMNKIVELRAKQSRRITPQVKQLPPVRNFDQIVQDTSSKSLARGYPDGPMA